MKTAEKPERFRRPDIPTRDVTHMKTAEKPERFKVPALVDRANRFEVGNS